VQNLHNDNENFEALVSVILPTLNEERAISKCIKEVKEGFINLKNKGYDLKLEIIVADSSTDRTAEIAGELGAKVIKVKEKGYGIAYLKGFDAAHGEIIVMGDADGTYDFRELDKLILPILKGEADFVIGSRFKGEIKKGAMSLLHRIGNRMLTFVLNWLFDLNISDAHSGFRAIKKSALEKLNLKADGMEFASEMFIEASKAGLRIKEVPIVYRKRIGKSKLHSFKDGWRHLRFMLLYKPYPLLIYPGLILTVFGFVLMLILYFRGNIEATSMHSFILGAIAFLTGFNSLLFGTIISAYSTVHGFTTSKLAQKILDYHSLEKEILTGIILVLAGALLGVRIVYTWVTSGFGGLSQFATAVSALVLISAGIQIIYSAFFLSMLLIRGKNS